jgi:acyl dehydratase
MPELSPELRAQVGVVGRPTTTLIERGAIARFADAVGDWSAAYLSTDPIAPPTFLASLPYDRPALAVPASSGVLNLANRFVIGRPVRTGDLITTRATITRMRQRAALLLVDLECTYTDASGAWVGTGSVTWGITAGDIGASESALAVVDLPADAGVSQGSVIAETPWQPPEGACTDRPAPCVSDLHRGLQLPPLSKAPITTRQLVKYAGASGDLSPIHYDHSVAVAHGLPRVVAHGLLKMAFFAQHALTWAGSGSRLLELTANYHAPDFAGDVITSHAEVQEVDRLSVVLALRLRNQRGDDTTSGTARIELSRSLPRV